MMRWLNLSAVLLILLSGCGVARPTPAGLAACAPGIVPPVLAPSALVDRLRALKVMNYYPARDGWTYMWTRWKPDAIDADFARIAAANANAVRIIVHPTVFGYPEVDPAQLPKLTDVVERAHAHGLRVQLTLFDWWADYGRVAESKRWVDAVLAPYRDDPRIAFVELQNEMDSTNESAVSWARELVPYTKRTLGSTPVTISVSGSAGLPGLQRLVDAQLGLDFYDLHYYGKPALAGSTFRCARILAGTMPVRIGETGYATRDDPDPQTDDGATWTEEAQDQFFRTVALGARGNDLPPIAPWIWSDFAPDAIPRTRSVAPVKQYAYGLVRDDGTPKRALASVAAIFGDQPIDLGFNNGFEDGDGDAPRAGWQLWRPDLARFGRDTDVRHGGVASARIERSGAHEQGYPAFYVAPIAQIEAGRTYRASVWARGAEATGTTRITLAWFDQTGSFLLNTPSEALPEGTTDWQQLSVSETAPPNAAMVEIHLVSANNTGTAWFDDVTFE